MTGLVITGCCPLGAFGLGREALAGFLTGRNAPTTPFRVAPMDVLGLLGTRNKRTKKMDRLSGLVSVAALQAMTEAGVDRGSIAAGRGAVVTGSGRGALESILAFHRQLATDGPDSVDPGVFPPTSHNVAGGHVSIEFGLSGPLLHLASGAAASADALVVAADLVSAGRADLAVTGGFDLLGEDVEAMLGPPDGPPWAEGLGLLVLERDDGARQREAAPLARICGWGTARRVDAASSVAAACRAARADDAPVDLVLVAHPRTSETDEGLQETFGGCVPPTWEPSRLLGDTTGARFALTVAVAVVALEAGLPTAAATMTRPSDVLVVGLNRGQAVALRLGAAGS